MINQISTAYVDGPLVSVIMATYNRTFLLNEAIESILNQTYTNFELIIQDDGSPNIHEMKEILESYQRKDSRVKVFYSDVN